MLTHWGWVTHICVSKLASIVSDNGLSPGRRQAIIWTNTVILLIGPLGTNFIEILIDILSFSFKKMHLKVSSAKWRPFCFGHNVLSRDHEKRYIVKSLISWVHTQNDPWLIFFFFLMHHDTPYSPRDCCHYSIAMYHFGIISLQMFKFQSSNQCLFYRSDEAKTFFYHCSGDDMVLLWYLLSPSDNFWALRNICSKISIKILLSNKCILISAKCEPYCFDLKILTCAFIASSYDEEAQELICDYLGVAYPIHNGIPNFIPTDARKLPSQK